MTINITEKLFIELQSEWYQLKGGYNWYTFTPILIQFENEKWLHGFSLEITLLGFTMYVRYNTDEALQIFDDWDEEAREGEAMSFEDFKKSLK